MSRSKQPDLVVEAVRYKPDGRIDFVRAYERRGNIWTDCFLLSRSQLVEYLVQGKRVTVGKRKPYYGNTFEFDMPLRLVDQTIVANGSGFPGGEDIPAPRL